MQLSANQSQALPDQSVTILVDGVPVTARAGQTVAAALIAAGQRAWRRSRHGQVRGVFCGIGICFDCLVTVDGQANVRACLTQVREGMQVETDATGGKAL